MNAALVALATALLPAAHAATSTLAVPTFSVDYSEWGVGWNPGYPATPAGFSVAATNNASTTISLDTMAQFLHQDSSGMSVGAYREAFAAMHFTAAEGYRITAIEFSATVYGVLDLPFAPPGYVNDNYPNEPTNITQISTGIQGAPTQQFEWNNFTSPFEVTAATQNSAGLAEFDYSISVLAAGYGGKRWIHSEDWTHFSHILGNSEVHYVDPILTVYTQAIPVPEPGTWAMLVCGLVLLAGARAARPTRH